MDADVAWLTVAFFAVAGIYASAGFGGGSTYTALLALAAVDYRLIPIISLSCNLLVTAQGTWLLAREQLVSAVAIPLCLASVPAAHLAARLPIPQTPFLMVLGIALLVAAALTLPRWQQGEGWDLRELAPMRRWIAGVGFGIPLGALAGVTGIGGGIYLAPVLHWMRIGKAKQIAALCSCFILVNSIAGLAGQFTKSGGSQSFVSYAPLPVAAILGGLIGSRLLRDHLATAPLRQITAAVIAVAALRVLFVAMAG